MGLTRRLLMAGTGGGSFTLPPPPEDPVVFDVSASPDGGWTPISTPQAMYYNGKTYVGYIDNSGRIRVRAITNADQSVTSPTTLYTGDADWHSSPAVLVRSSDRRILVLWMPVAGGVDATNVYTRLSSNPEDVSAFGSTETITGQVGGIADYTYPSMIELTDEGRIYVFYREGVAPNRLSFTYSDDDGATWATRTQLFINGSARAYWTINSNGTDRIDFQVQSGYTGYDAAPSLYHFYYTGGSYYKSDGTLIAGGLPLDTTDVTLVYDGTTTPSLVPFGIITNGGNPCMVHNIDPAAGNNSWVYHRWNGSAWVQTTIADAGATSSSGGFRESGIAILEEGHVFAGVYTSGKWEMFRYTSTDAGATWSASQLTSGSANHHISPVAVRDAATGAKFLWLYGTGATSGTGYTLGTKGWG